MNKTLKLIFELAFVLFGMVGLFLGLGIAGDAETVMTLVRGEMIAVQGQLLLCTGLIFHRIRVATETTDKTPEQERLA
jgi:hypothetical protein